MAPESPIRQEDNAICNVAPFCGLPFYSCRQLHTGGFWLPAAEPLIREEAELLLKSRIKVNDINHQLKFSINGMHIEICCGFLWCLLNHFLLHIFFRKLLVLNSTAIETRCLAGQLGHQRQSSNRKCCQWPTRILYYGDSWSGSSTTQFHAGSQGKLIWTTLYWIGFDLTNAFENNLRVGGW